MLAAGIIVSALVLALLAVSTVMAVAGLVGLTGDGVERCPFCHHWVLEPTGHRACPHCHHRGVV